LGSAPQTVLRPEEAFPKAEAAARKALELDPSLAEAHVSLGYADLSYEHNYSKSEQEFKQALRLRPNYPTVHQYYGYYLTAMGRLKDAIRERQEARNLDPLSPLLNSALGEAYYQARDYDRTIGANEKALNLDPRYAIAMINLGRAYEQKKLYSDAGRIFQQMLAVAPDEPAILALVGHDYALAGNQPAALKLLAQLQADAATRYVPALYFAMIYTGLGDKDQAFQWLNKAYDERCDYLINLPSEPLADPLRSDARFAELLRRLNLNQVPETLQ
jgi:tetratricopeptide (TPR) repeat protein